MIADTDRQVKFDLQDCVVFDLECYATHWCVGFLHPGGHQVVQTKSELSAALHKFAAAGKTICGYNSLHFDVPLIRGILRGIDPFEPAMRLIADEPHDSVFPGSLPGFPCDHIDLAMRLKRGRSFPSLKTVAAYLGRRILRELPFSPGSELSDEQWTEVISYNKVDLEHTWTLLERLTPDLQALALLSEEFGKDLRSVTTPQVVERIFRAQFKKESGFDPVRQQSNGPVLYRPVEGVLRPRNDQAACWFDQVTQPIPIVEVKDRPVPQVPKAEFSLGKLKIKVGAGGLHSVDQPGVWYANKREMIISVDVASYYPSLIATKGITPTTYGDTGLSLYRSILDRRLAVKQGIKETTDEHEKEHLKVQADGLKLIINSYFGKTSDSFSTLYDPTAFLAVTLSGQLMLIDLIERLQAVKVQVISANTDGLYLRIRRDNRSWEAKIKEWQADTGMVLEVEPLLRLAILATNQYATLSRKGEIKRKGAALRGDLDWIHSPKWLVINDAVVEALLRDEPPEKTIFDCSDMVRFCSVVKRAGKAISMTMGDVELPKVARFYKAKDSEQVIQVHYEGGRTTTPAGGKGVVLCQDLPDNGRLGGIDFAWYLGEARRRVQKVRRYHHRAPTRLQGAELPNRVHALGLWPVPKRGKALPAGADVKLPTFLWEWGKYATVGVYTGPACATLVIDIDDPLKFSGFCTGLDLGGPLVSWHGSATPEGVRAGRERGKLIYRLPGEHPELSKSAVQKRLYKKFGFETFYGQAAAMPSILGKYDDTDEYRLDGVLTEAPGWLVAAITPPPVKHRAKKAPVSSQTELAFQEDCVIVLDGVPAMLADLNPQLATCNWRRKEQPDRTGVGDIFVAACPFGEDPGKDDISCGVNLDGEPYLKCLRANCTQCKMINNYIKIDHRRKLAAKAIESQSESQSDGSFVLADFGEILSEIREDPVRWLADQRIAAGKIHLAIGPGGVGKSTYALTKLAALTRGGVYPGGPRFNESGKVAILAVEDDKADTIKPRFVAAGGDASKVLVLKTRVVKKDKYGRETILYAVFKDLDYWRKLFDIWQPLGLVADPIQAFMGRGVNDSRNSEVRDILEPFSELLQEYDVFLEAITHTPKKIESNNAAEMAINSVAYPNISRVVHVHWQDPDAEDHYLITQSKNTLGKKQPIIGYTIAEHRYELDGKVFVPGKIVCDTSVPEITERELLAQFGTHGRRGENAIPWLEDRFREARIWPSKELLKAAKECGISRNALFSKEVRALPIKRELSNGIGSEWHWSAKPGWPPLSATGTLGTDTPKK